MKALILGGGITGLSAAWHLFQKDPSVKITLLERTDRLGGAIGTSYEGGFLFEKGPRTFQMGKCPHLIHLIEQFQLPLLQSPPQKRYLWRSGKLYSLPSLLPKLLPSLLLEPFKPKRCFEDESIYDFAARRFSPKVATQIFDPMTLGIYAGDIKKLSIRSCFPALYEAEKTKTSVLKAMFSASSGLFTLRHGMQTLIDALKHQIPMQVIYNTTVQAIGSKEVTANGKIWKADLVLSALPPSLPTKSIWVVHLGYRKEVLKKQGFGYLVPTSEKSNVLGVVFDSSIFPEQSQKGETRLTVMLRAEEKEPLQTALSHLNLDAGPAYTAVFFAKNAIPQMEVGCGYFEGISVEASILKGKKLTSFH